MTEQQIAAWPTLTKREKLAVLRQNQRPNTTSAQRRTGVAQLKRKAVGG